MKHATKSGVCLHCNQAVVTSGDGWLHTDLTEGCRNEWREPLGTSAEPRPQRSPVEPVYSRPYRHNNPASRFYSRDGGAHDHDR